MPEDLDDIAERESKGKKKKTPVYYDFGRPSLEELTEKALSEPRKKGFLRRLTSYASLAATTALGLAVAGPVNTAIFAGAFIAGNLFENRGKTSYNSIKSEINKSNLLVNLTHANFGFYNSMLNKASIDSIVGAGVLGAPLIMAYQGAYFIADYLTKYYTPGKLLKELVTFQFPKTLRHIYHNEIKRKIGTTTKRTAMYLAPAYAALIFLVPYPLQTVAAGAVKFLQRMVFSFRKPKAEVPKIEPGNYAPQMQPEYRPPAPGPAGPQVPPGNYAPGPKY